MKTKTLKAAVLLATVAFSFLLSQSANAALIPSNFLNNVVSLGTSTQSVTTPRDEQNDEWSNEGTGFFYGYLVENDPAPEKRKYEIYLVTAKHVIQGHLATSTRDLEVRVNANKSKSRGTSFAISNTPQPGESSWFFHPDPSIDVAAVRINAPLLQELDFQFGFFASDLTAANREKMKELEIVAGDGVFVLGFPMSLAGAQRNHVIVRQGCIARISEMLDEVSTSFMVDAFVFPGNSGGPVILKPEVGSLTGTQSHPSSVLIGVITSYRPYRDVAYSMQTKQPRVMFEENSGLADVLPIDYINEAIRAWRSIPGERTSQRKN